MKEKFKAKLILTIGMSNSGKSTWAKKFVKDNPMYREINRDELRIAAFCGGDSSKYNDYKFSKSKEQLVTDMAICMAKNAVSNGQGIVISDTNLNGKTRNNWQKFAEQNRYEYEEKVFDTLLHICMGRNHKRAITLPTRVLVQQYSSYRQFKGMPTYTGTAGKPDAVIVDVDGTLMDMEGVRKPFEWDKVLGDKPRTNVCNTVELLHAVGLKIIIVSGRDSVCREDTIKSLEAAGVPMDEVFLREAGNSDPDSVVKEKIFWDNIACNYNVKFCIDDRDQMVHQWRAMGIECWQVAYGDF